jgi:FkbM family methyltransferase
VWDVTFRMGSQDPVTFVEQFQCNPYRIPDGGLVGATVVDVGANAGFFAVRCLAEGASLVVCYEPDPANVPYLVQNVESFMRAHPQYGRALVFSAAVWGDGSEGLMLGPHGSPIYTAMTQVRRAGPGENPDVKTVSMQEVLAQVGHVDLLKLDCEGSEFPILYQTPCEAFRHVERIAGEVHWGMAAQPGTSHLDTSREGFARRVESLGFRFEYGETSGEEPGQVTLFHATKV